MYEQQVEQMTEQMDERLALRVFFCCSVSVFFVLRSAEGTYGLDGQLYRLMAYINYAPMRIGAEDPWALTELAKAGGPGGAQA